jgi:hypothetical protein
MLIVNMFKSLIIIFMASGKCDIFSVALVIMYKYSIFFAFLHKNTEFMGRAE